MIYLQSSVLECKKMLTSRNLKLLKLLARPDNQNLFFTVKNY